MREILFRGKGTYGLNEGDWIYGYYVKDFWKPTRCGCGIIPIDKERGGYCEVDLSTIGQYTGLTDKNGKKIFEGDILQTEKNTIFCNSYIAVVKYINGSFIADCFCELIADNFCFCEVIGNIYDNPKLLKECESD